MEINEKTTPSGLKDILFDECAKIRGIERNLNRIFMKKGYREVMTPSLEYLSLFSHDSSFIPSENMYKTMDNKGKMMAIRPDSTIPIARLVSTKLKEKVTRLFYNQKTFRMNEKHSGRSDELIQSGVELIGVSGKDGDMEIVSLALDALRIVCGKQKARFEIGYAPFFESLCLEVGILNDREFLRNAICEKNQEGVEEILKSYEDSNAKKALRKLPLLFGGEEVIKEAKEVFKGTNALKEMPYFTKIYKEILKLSGDIKVIIDLGQLTTNHYYTGMLFSAFVGGIGDALIKGGRYDRLYEIFGEKKKAVGFGVNIDLALTINQYDTTKRPLRIAITKGRIEKKTLELFQKIGYDCQGLINKGRKLIIPISNNVEVVLAKSNDVITYIEQGACDLGIVGKDTIVESYAECFELLDLKFGKCHFAVAAKNNRDIFNDGNFRTVASKFPNVTKDYFQGLGMDIDIIKIDGSVELAPLLGISDAIVDLVETGNTLKENNLEVKAKIKDVSTRLIANKASLKLRKKEIDTLVKELSENI